MRDPQILPPLTWITERDLFEPGAVYPVRASRVEVARHHGFGLAPDMPITGKYCAAPWAKPGYTWNSNKVLAHRPMINENNPSVLWDARQSYFRLPAAFQAPVLPALVRRWIQQKFVRTHSVLFASPAPNILARHVIRPKTVVVQQ